MISRLQKLAYLTLLLPGLVLASSAESGKALYGTCVACHGANAEGNAELLAPGLAGQSESYLTRQIWDFKNRRRGAEPDDTTGAQMLAMADTLTDGSAVADVAAYLASLPANQPPVTVTGNAENGQQQFTSKCGACHGGQGWGNEALFTPKLTVIGDSYIVRQVENFQNGVRGVHQDAKYGKQMAMMAKVVSEQELNDIVAFLNDQSAEQQVKK
jgi:cytochrome c oxidase subunit 2